VIEQRELRELENGCTQDDPPACTAACPAHVDVPAMLALASRGDWPGALRVLKRTLPFPGVIGRVCPRPCQPVCKRAEVGDAVSIAAVEQASADFGGASDRPRVLPPRGRRVAVVGGGLSGLTAAYDLARKGYGVVVHESGDRLGGSLWRTSADQLPRAVLRAEVSVVDQIGVRVEFGARLDAADLAALSGGFDAVYLATGTGGDPFGLAGDGRGGIRVDPAFATNRAGVFAGGSLLRDAAGHSAIESLSDGRRAAISIDRYLQNVSLTAARSDTGATTTRLFTSTDGVAVEPAVPMSTPAVGYQRAEAAREAQRCLRCSCMECVKVCAYLERYRGYPRRYVREVYNNLSIVKGERRANRFINSCSLCGLCGVVCPTGLTMGDVVKKARQIMVEQDRMPSSAHDFALRDMAFSNGGECALSRHRPGSASSEYVFFPGCQLAASSPEHVDQVYAYLRDRLGDVGLMLRCCGAPADWAGRAEMFQSSLADLRAEHEALGAPTVVLACSSCHRIFAEHLPEVPVVSLWTVLEEHGPPQPVSPGRGAGAVAVHDPCGTRHDSAIQDSVRNILTSIGYEIEELPLSRERTECCGYGGEMWLANPDLAKEVVERRIARSELDYVTYCAVCRDFFAASGKRTRHLLDLLFGQDQNERATRVSPGYSDRHENRARLKRALLRDLWEEDVAGPDGGTPVRLVIAEDVRSRLEERLILVEDIQQVIAYAERTRRRLWNRQTGHWLARYRPHVVTYWVEYTMDGDAFVIHNSYSHRMRVTEGTSP
jgi:NADPH-dependent glutamate synthase beta subunit-like oxidoreductase